MAQEPRQLFPADSVLEWFGAELRHWRSLRGLSQAGLAGLVHFAAELVCKVEKGERWPSRALSEACDAVLDAGGVLTRMWPLVENARLHQYGLGRWGGAGPFGRRLPAMSRALPARDTGRGAPSGDVEPWSSPEGVPQPAPAAADPLGAGGVVRRCAAHRGEAGAHGHTRLRRVFRPPQ